MLIDAQYECPHCGEPNFIFIDASAGSEQSYVEDCQICCRPNLLSINVESDGQSATIEAEPESD